MNQVDQLLIELSSSVVNGSVIAAAARVRKAREEAKMILDKHEAGDLGPAETIEKAFPITLDCLKDLDALLSGAVRLIHIMDNHGEKAEAKAADPEMN